MEIIAYILGISIIAFCCIFGKLAYVSYRTFRHIRENAMFRYDRDMAKRFVSDLKIPVGVIYPEWIFCHQLKLYGELPRWEKLWELIDERYDGDAHKFLDDYYQIRDRIIKETLDNSAYQEFIRMDMNKFRFERPKDISKNNVYNGEQLGKLFLSVDMSKANFQALRYVSPDIVKGTETYRDFIKLYTDLDYVADSKYTRQVVFGKLNVDRQMTVERYITFRIWEIIRDMEDILKSASGLNEYMWLRSMSNDELIFEVYPEQEKDRLTDVQQRIVSEVKSKLGIDVHTELFTLNGWQLVSPTNSEVCQTFFEKVDFISGESKLVCVPLPYHNIIYKLWKKDEIYDADKYFIYEKMVCKFTDTFKLVPLEKSKKNEDTLSV